MKVTIALLVLAAVAIAAVNCAPKGKFRLKTPWNNPLIFSITPPRLLWKARGASTLRLPLPTPVWRWQTVGLRVHQGLPPQPQGTLREELPPLPSKGFGLFVVFVVQRGEQGVQQEWGKQGTLDWFWWFIMIWSTDSECIFDNKKNTLNIFHNNYQAYLCNPCQQS